MTILILKLFNPTTSQSCCPRELNKRSSVSGLVASRGVDDDNQLNTPRLIHFNSDH